jgi:AcrR family transcriptional regulator
MNDAETGTRLLREARRLFAECGYRGASVRAITQAAHANLGAVTYHFGTKDALYQAVLGTVFGQLADRVETAAAIPGTAPDRLRAIVAALFAFFREAPDAPHLILHQLATGAGLPAAVLPFLRRNLTAMRTVVADGVAAGELRPLEPTLVVFTIISQAVWFAIAGREIPAILGDATDHSRFAARVEQHVAEVVARFVTKEGVAP